MASTGWCPAYGNGGLDRRRPSAPTAPAEADSSIDAALDGWEDRRLLLDHIPDAVFATDAADRITHWTRSAERLFGYSASEAIGRSLGELLGFTVAQPGDELGTNRRSEGRADVARSGHCSAS